jgi:hypothetical protein
MRYLLPFEGLKSFILLPTNSAEEPKFKIIFNLRDSDACKSGPDNEIPVRWV